MKLLVAAIAMVVLTATAQNYRCDWNVVGIGGCDMSSTVYRCGSTAGQTAAGLLSGNEFLAVVGFWQADYETGIADKQGPVLPKGLVTRLDAVAPNPFQDRTRVRYSLATEGLVSIVVLDLAGRAVRTLVNRLQTPGRYTADWDGVDHAGRKLANGIYFCRFTSGDCQEVRKLVQTR